MFLSVALHIMPLEAALHQRFIIETTRIKVFGVCLSFKSGGILTSMNF